MIHLYPKNKLPLSAVKRFILSFYLVGLIGFVLPFSQSFFIRITPLALVLNVYLLALYHESYSARVLILFALIYLLGFFTELVGVQTGIIFGTYTYAHGLGPKVWGTPLLIGVNWLFLSYSTLALLLEFKLKEWIAVLVSPFLMLLYDLILEQVAPSLHFWSWQNNVIPLQNYLAWFGLALCFSLLFKLFRVQVRNPLALILFASQFIFFILLNILL